MTPEIAGGLAVIGAFVMPVIIAKIAVRRERRRQEQDNLCRYYRKQCEELRQERVSQCGPDQWPIEVLEKYGDQVFTSPEINLLARQERAAIIRQQREQSAEQRQTRIMAQGPGRVFGQDGASVIIPPGLDPRLRQEYDDAMKAEQDRMWQAFRDMLKPYTPQGEKP